LLSAGGGVASPGPRRRTAKLAPAAGQKRAETTANTSKATNVSSPDVSPNMRLL
jgi:hypothetical protein